MMQTETLTLEEAQRKVLEATRGCPDCKGTGSMGTHLTDLHPTNHSPYPCVSCNGTRCVLLFPKAGEECPDCYGEGYIYRSSWTDGCTNCGGSGKETARGSAKFVVGAGFLPTQDIGRLLEAVWDAGWYIARWEDGLIVLREHLKPYREVTVGGHGNEALWRALGAMVDAQ